jgi:hypothetical protein
MEIIATTDDKAHARAFAVRFGGQTMAPEGRQYAPTIRVFRFDTTGNRLLERAVE